jgi:hypothetical protein
MDGTRALPEVFQVYCHKGAIVFIKYRKTSKISKLYLLLSFGLIAKDIIKVGTPKENTSNGERQNTPIKLSPLEYT